MAQQNIHYFPGHMQKALRMMEGYIKTVDLVVELVDARAPSSSRNPLLQRLMGQKPALLLLSKADYADPYITSSWIDYFKDKGLVAISGNLKKDRFVNILASASKDLVAKKREKEKRFGMKPQPIKVMIIGIPNVGKSTLINNIGGKKAAAVGNKAGVTRAEQWIKLNQDFLLLDTPGILPMNYPTREQAIHLALVGSMREDVLPTYDLGCYLIEYLRSKYEKSLQNRFEIDNLTLLTNDDVLVAIAKRRMLFDSGEPSLERAAYLLIKEFKDGLIGDISLEEPNA